MITKKTEENPEIYKKTCPHCGKDFCSLSRKQLLFNYTSHIGSCEFKNKKKEDKK